MFKFFFFFTNKYIDLENNVFDLNKILFFYKIKRVTKSNNVKSKISMSFDVPRVIKLFDFG